MTESKKQKLVHISGAPVYLETSSAPTNIATIKYWGKADAKWNTPINDSVSVTLNQDDLKAVTTVAACTAFEQDRLWLNGEEEEGAATNKRFRACVDGVRALATDKKDEHGNMIVSKADWEKMHIHVSSYNTFPTAAGLASSAAGYAALVAALSLLFGAKEEFPGQLTTIARQGSGSACRSLSGGFVAWRKGGKKDDWSDSLAEQVADEKHWPEIRAVIMVVSDAKKDTSSTAGMNTSVETSLLLKHRAETVVSKRMEDIEKAFLAKDFETFGQLTMADSNQFHATCMDTYPPIFYMNDVSQSIIRIIHAYNKWAGRIRAAYTFDAGPNAVIFTLEEHAVEVGALMLHYYPEFGDKYLNNSEFEAKIKAFQLDKALLEATDKTGRDPVAGQVKMMYYTSSGPGPQRLTDTIVNLDPTTGLNTYKP
jgi:diphosphomevalonate decarboxylase